MPGQYNEENNKTEYPLNGGIRPNIAPEQLARLDELEARNAQLATENAYLREQRDAYLSLLRLAIGGTNYGMNNQNAFPYSPTKLGYPTNPLGAPIVTCHSEGSCAKANENE